MPLVFEQHSVSVVLLRPARLPYGVEFVPHIVRAALSQDVAPGEVLVVDGRGPAAPRDFMPVDADATRLRHLPADYANRAAMLNAALRAASGEYVLVLFCEQAPVLLRRAALQTLVMAATRVPSVAYHGASAETQRPIGLVYADYERQQADGTRQDVYLLDWHPGRLRDTVDFGAAVLLRTAALRELGGADERYATADWYDLRLRLSEKYAIAHIANRFAGALYSVVAPAQAHNVFDYLLAGRSAQLEMEQALTAHLKRSGAYLAPGAHVRTVTYTPAEEAQFKDCLATVITPVFKRPEFIGRAIESVQAQTERRVEMLVVVNGGESDPTAAAVRRYMPGGDRHRPYRPPVRLLVVDINNLGLCFNYGLQHARGKFYVQLDSDDRLKPDAVAKLLAVFASDPTIGMVVGSYEVWTLDAADGQLRRNAEIPVVTHAEWTADHGRNNLLRINGAGAPRAAHIKVIREVGWFGVNDTPQSRNYGEDYDLVLRISERYTIGRVWEPIYEVIRHAGGTDHAIDQATIDRNDDAKDNMRLEALRRRVCSG